MGMTRCCLGVMILLGERSGSHSSSPTALRSMGRALGMGSCGSALLQCSSGRSQQPSAECWDSASPLSQWVGSCKQKQCHTWVTSKSFSVPMAKPWC